MTAGPWQHATRTRRGAPAFHWSGMADDFADVTASVSLMRRWAWTARIGPQAPPVPKILLDDDHQEDAWHPGPSANGLISDQVTWTLDTGYSRQLEKIDYAGMEKPIRRKAVDALVEALMASDPLVMGQVNAGVTISGHMQDRRLKGPSLSASAARHPYCARIRSEVTVTGPNGAGGRMAVAKCHPVTLAAMNVAGLMHHDSPDREFFGFYGHADVRVPASATARTIERNSRRDRIEAAYGLLEGRGLPDLVAMLRARG